MFQHARFQLVRAAPGQPARRRWPAAAAAAILLSALGADAQEQSTPAAAPASSTVVAAARPPAPIAWCLSNEVYLEAMWQFGIDATGCIQYGPCDDPLTRDASIPTASTPIKTIQLIIHIFCENNGRNCAATLEDADTAVARLNEDFLPWRIQFVHTAHFVKSTKYRYLDRTTESAQMKAAYATSPSTMLNIYVVDTGGVSWGIAPWIPYALDAQGGIVMHEEWFVATSRIPTVLTHEVGHCLGLYHTFRGVDETDPCSDCYEYAGRTSEVGDITGDFCSDTNPTPSNPNNCSDPLDLDPCTGGPWFDTPYLNYMGYSRDCPIEFTPQQAGRMHCWTDHTLSGWLTSPPPPPPPAAPGAPVLTPLGEGLIGIEWVDNSADEDGFRIERERRQGRWRDTTIIATVPANTTSTTDAPGAGTFRYRVQAFSNASGDSSWSGWTQIDN